MVINESVWVDLDEDWSDYHPTARVVVPDPALWAVSYDYAPNGNDTGADLLWELKGSGHLILLDEGRALLDARLAAVSSLIESSGGRHDYLEREYVLGLAFCFLKIHGYCPKWLRDRSLTLLDELLAEDGSRERDYPLDDHARKLLGSSRTVLLDCPTTKP